MPATVGQSMSHTGQLAKVVAMLAVLAVAGLALEYVERSVDLGPTPKTLTGEEGSAALAGRHRATILDQMRLGVGDSAFPWPTPTLAPSSLAIDVSELDRRRSYISIVVDQADLYDPNSGLLTNPLERGRAWERVANVSFFDAGELVWATRAGLRRHGGASRTAPRASWRLYFRGEYGSDATRQPILRERAVAPLRLVVRREPPGYPNVMGFEVARQAGALTPAFRPARAFVNGEDQGNYLLVEHVNPDGWVLSQFGHTNVLMFIHRASSSAASVRRYRDLTEWVATTPAPLSMVAVAERVDLDNLLRHLFTFIFCGTADWAQGAAVLDNTTPVARWFWLHWDLDQSFRIRGGTAGDGPGIGLIVEGDRPDMRNDVRARIFNRLRREDPGFAAHFTALVTELLNHSLVTEFFDDLMDRYRPVLRRRRRTVLREYFERRPEIIRAELGTYLDAGQSYQVSIEGPVGLALIVDGYPEESGYRGWYFVGMHASVSVADDLAGFSHWVVNGRRRNGRRLVAEVSGTTSIRAVMR